MKSDPELTLALSHAQFDLANRLFFRLYQSSNLLHKHGTRAVAGVGSTIQQWGVLGALARPRALREGMSLRDLTDFLMVSRQNLAGVLERLESRGWVEKMTVDGDARLRRRRLSRSGIEAWDAMLGPISEFYRAALDDLSVEERLRLYQLLDRLKQGLAVLNASQDDLPSSTATRT
ncbi:MarR family transcriptional regulator [Micromonospora sp. STR1s_5]|nr:MarR family transcriptional regulator [Micromonospora sp. STR1s_5]